MKLLILFILSRFGLCQDNIEASVDILRPKLGSCTLPGEFTVTVRTHNDSVTLQLVTSTSVKSTAPVYVYRQERGSPVVVRDTVLELEKTAEYQDVTHLSNMEVSCVVSENNQPYYIFDGFLLFSDQRMFELKPARSASGDIKYTLTSSTVHTNKINIRDHGRSKNGRSGNGRSGNGRSGNGRSGSDWERMTSHSLRKKRQIQSPIYVDVLAVIELSVYKRWFARSTQPTQALKDQETKQGLRRHFAHLVNGVDLRYKAASPLYNMNLVGYIIEDELSPKPFQNAIVNTTKIEGNQLLKDIRSWKTTTAGFPDNDHVVVFTALDLYDVDQAGVITDLVGYAEIGAVCEYPEDSASVVEYTDSLVDDMLVTTHEIGHALDALHDGDQNTCNSSYNYIMSSNGYGDPQELANNNYYFFSTCSQFYIQNFIEKILASGTDTQKECLQKPLAPVSVTNITGTMPGQLYDVHTQCQMLSGPGFFMQLDVDIDGPENICKRMPCGKEEFDSYHDAADGTPCGNKKWCVAGRCVLSTDAPEQKNLDCLYGDQPVVYPENKTCDELIGPSLSNCYSYDYFVVCCKTCLDNKRNDGCPYGDDTANDPCAQSSCATSGPDYRQRCCDTCGISTTTTTASTTPTTTTSSTTTTTTPITTTSTTTTSASTTTTTTTPPASTTTSTTTTATTTTTKTTTTTTTDTSSSTRSVTSAATTTSAPLPTTPATSTSPSADTTVSPPSDFLTETQKIIIGASVAGGLGIIIIAVVVCVKRGVCKTRTNGKKPHMRTEDFDNSLAPPLGESTRGAAHTSHVVNVV